MSAAAETTGAAPAASSCPVATLAREALAVHAAMICADAASVRGRAQDRPDAQRTYDLLSDRLEALEAAAAERRATSLEGAMFAVMLAHDAAQRLEIEPDAADRKETGRRVSRLLHSVLRVLEAASGTPAAAVCGEIYMSDRLDPLAAVEAALARAGGAA